MKKTNNMQKRISACVRMAVMSIAVLTANTGADTVFGYTISMNLNEAISVISDKEEVFEFTAPSAGTYYFYSDSEGEVDTYATLEYNKKVEYSDDTENGDVYDMDFSIKADLAKGDVCTLTVASHNDSYVTEVYVVDENTAKATVLMDLNYEFQYVTMNTKCEMSVGLYNLAEGAGQEIPEGYSVKWTKETDNETVDLDKEGLEYKLISAKFEDTYLGVNDYAYYKATLYYDGEECDSKCFRLMDDSLPYHIYGEEANVSVGDEIVLYPNAMDCYQYYIDIDDSDIYSYEWYVYKNGEMTKLEGTGLEYNLTVTEGDCISAEDNDVHYVCNVYAYGEYMGFADFYLTDKNKYVECQLFNTVETLLGENTELRPNARDYRGVAVDEENSDVTWYKYDAVSGECTEIGNSFSYVIDEVTMEDAQCEYYCELSYNGGKMYEMWFDLLIADYSYNFGFDYSYAMVGESRTLSVQAQDFYWNEADLTTEEFTFKWYKINEDYLNGEYEEEFKEYVGTEATYTIASVEEEDFESYYICEVYKNGYYIGSYDAKLFDGAKYIQVPDRKLEAFLGTSFDLELQALDYYGNEIQLNSEDYVFEWYKIVGENTYKLTTEGPVHTISRVVKSDFYKEAEDSNYYVCEFYAKDYSVQYYVVFYLYEAEVETTTPEETSTEAPTTKAPETTEVPTTKAPETTTVAPTTKAPETTVAPTTSEEATTAKVEAPAKAKVKKVAAKKKASKAVKVTLKKIKDAKGYEVQISKAKKFNTKNILAKKFSKKIKVTLKNKKLANKKKLFVRARAYTLDANGNKVNGKWSSVKKVTIK